MIAYTAGKCGRALLTLLGLAVIVAVITAGLGTPCPATTGEISPAPDANAASAPCGSGLDPGPALGWLAAAARLDGGRTSDGGRVTAAIAAALPATLLLVSLSLLFALLAGWIGGAVLAFNDAMPPPDPVQATGRPSRRPGRVRGRAARLAGRAAAGLADLGQGTPVFWYGGLLVAVFSVGLGWVPPGGIVSDNMLPAFGTPAYGDALAAQPLTVLGDLLAHILLPALTLAAAGLATDLRLVRAALPAELRAPHTLVARALGRPPRRLVRRAARAAFPAIVGGSAAGAPLAASALVLVEYLFGWPGVGLLAYRAARTGDSATLGALALLFGFVVIVIGLLADLLAAWADPRRRLHPGLEAA